MLPRMTGIRGSIVQAGVISRWSHPTDGVMRPLPESMLMTSFEPAETDLVSPE